MEVSEILLRFTLTLIWTKKRRSGVSCFNCNRCSHNTLFNSTPLLLSILSQTDTHCRLTGSWPSLSLWGLTSGAGETENCTLSKVRPRRETGKCFSTMTIRTGSRAFHAPTAAPSLLGSPSWFLQTQSANGLVGFWQGLSRLVFNALQCLVVFRLWTEYLKRRLRQDSTYIFSDHKSVITPGIPHVGVTQA